MGSTEYHDIASQTVTEPPPCFIVVHRPLPIHFFSTLIIFNCRAGKSGGAALRYWLCLLCSQAPLDGRGVPKQYDVMAHMNRSGFFLKQQYNFNNKT
jgi:hypothetical protein